MPTPYPQQITIFHAAKLGPAPATPDARRRQALPLLASGQATLGAFVRAWYGGDVRAAKHELYGWRGAVSHQEAILIEG